MDNLHEGNCNLHEGKFFPPFFAQLNIALKKVQKRKFDNLEGNLEGLLERIRKRKLQIENERDAY